MSVVTSAPTRIDLAGGTIDIWPLYLFHDGAATLNVAISLRAHAGVEPRNDGRIELVSVDTGRRIGAARWSDLDGSSALTIAAVAALARWSESSYEADDLLQIAMNIECQTIRVPTGVQDYRPALFGGIAAVELNVDGIRRVALDVDPRELQRRIVLAYTGAPRNSGTNNWDITKRHVDGDRAIFDCFERIRDTAAAMREALLRGDWDEVGRQIDREWDNRKRLAPGVTTEAIDGLMTRAKRAGATAAKVCGAGGGGCLFCYGPPDVRDSVAAALTAGGARVLEYRIDMEGLRVG